MSGRPSSSAVRSGSATGGTRPAFSLHQFLQRTTSSAAPPSPRSGGATESVTAGQSERAKASPRRPLSSPRRDGGAASSALGEGAPPRHLGSLQGLFRPPNPATASSSRPHSARDPSPSTSAILPPATSQRPPSGGFAKSAQTARPPTAPATTSSYANQHSFSLGAAAGIGSGGVGGGVFGVGLGGSGGGGGRVSSRGAARSQQAFHKGLISALGGVLKEQRAAGTGVGVGLGASGGGGGSTGAFVQPSPPRPNAPPSEGAEGSTPPRPFPRSAFSSPSGPS